MRRGEILGVQWKHAKLGSGLIELPATVTKTGIPRVVVISTRLASILECADALPTVSSMGLTPTSSVMNVAAR